jgi:F420-dependent oxidoreductase-like protein
MRIGLPGGGATVDKIVEQAQQAEADGFSSLWYASAVGGGDPMAAITAAGRATTTIEMGTSVLVTYACHPALQAYRSATVAAAIGKGRFTLGLGPSHQPVIENMFGLDYSTAGRNTDEYIQVVSQLLHGSPVSFSGDEYRVNAAGAQLVDDTPVPVLVAALAPRLLRVAGQHADGTILWMANATSIERHVAPRITTAAADAGRPAPRIVAGLPVAVHDDVDAAREEAARQFVMYGQLPNYRRILDHGDAAGPGDAAIVGDEAAVTAQIEALFAAGATDVWAAPFPVGDDRAESRRRTRALLKELATA